MEEPISRTYPYVGPDAIREGVAGLPMGTPISCPADVLAWRVEVGAAHADEVIVTFTVGAEGVLRIADRHSEHVACAGGGPVLGAGELTLGISGHQVGVVAVTNQSTGFCPEPASWCAVAQALADAQLDPPGDFTTRFTFRRCPQCASINLVKEEWFVCGCGADLPQAYNF